ncbi:hypothetical protein ACFE04_010720 [Oxalis oulophora]
MAMAMTMLLLLLFLPSSTVCLKFMHQYRLAAMSLSLDDPPIDLAIVNVSKDINKHLVIHHQVYRDPTVKILRDKGKIIEDYKGPQDSDGMADCFRRLSTPILSPQIMSLHDNAIIGLNKTVIVGVFSDFSGPDYDNFIKLAEIFKWDYDFYKHLDHGKDSCVPAMRLYNLFQDKDRFLELQTKALNVDTLVEFVKDNAKPDVILYNAHHQRFVSNFVFNPYEIDKAILFINNGDIHSHAFETKYLELAKKNRRQFINFMLVYLESGKVQFTDFDFLATEVPVIVIKNLSGELYVKSNLNIDSDIESWLEDYKAGQNQPKQKRRMNVDVEKSKPAQHDDKDEDMEVIVAENPELAPQEENDEDVEVKVAEKRPRWTNC